MVFSFVDTVLLLTLIPLIPSVHVSLYTFEQCVARCATIACVLGLLIYRYWLLSHMVYWGKVKHVHYIADHLGEIQSQCRQLYQWRGLAIYRCDIAKQYFLMIRYQHSFSQVCNDRVSGGVAL